MHARRGPPRVALFATLLASFIGMGMAAGLIGPTLIDLTRQAHSSLNWSPAVYTSRSFGVFAGTFIGGLIIDRFPRKGFLTLSLTTAAMSITTYIMPFCFTMPLVLGINLLQGLVIGIIDNCSQIVLVAIYGNEVGPYMQALHCTFGVGAFISPLVAAEFLHADIDVHADPSTWPALDRSYIWAYITMGTMMLGISIAAAVIAYKQRGDMEYRNGHFFSKIDEHDNVLDAENEPKDAENGSNSQTNTETPSMTAIPKSAKLRVVLLAGVLLGFYVGSETGCGSYISEYSVAQLKMNEQSASLMASVYWGCFALGRALAIPISVYMSSKTMVKFDLLGCSCSLLLIALYQHSETVLWFAAATYGLSIASIYPSVIVFMDSKVKMSGAYLSFLTMCATFGEAVIPLAIGESMARWQPFAFVLLQVAAAAMSTISFFTLSAYVSSWSQSIDRSSSSSSGTNQGKFAIDDSEIELACSAL